MNDRILLSKLCGYVPWLKTLLNKVGMSFASPAFLRHMLASRAILAKQARAAAEKEIKKLRIDSHFDVDPDHTYEAPNLLASLILARDP